MNLSLNKPVEHWQARAVGCILIRRLLEREGDTPAKLKFNQYSHDYFLSDIAEVRTEEGRLRLFAAIDRSCTHANAELHAGATKTVAALCLRHLMAAMQEILLPDPSAPAGTAAGLLEGVEVRHTTHNLERDSRRMHRSVKTG